ncbi:hypothetical protein ACQKWADRAFT_272727 [Trichoderma austrokoningii]
MAPYPQRHQVIYIAPSTRHEHEEKWVLLLSAFHTHSASLVASNSYHLLVVDVVILLLLLLPLASYIVALESAACRTLKIECHTTKTRCYHPSSHRFAYAAAANSLEDRCNAQRDQAVVPEGVFLFLILVHFSPQGPMDAPIRRPGGSKQKPKEAKEQSAPANYLQTTCRGNVSVPGRWVCL